ncbi:hypothetical protein [Bombilactobacillus mellifer]|nr:hypothetical protein [Bombilactobacillus mellifer]
MNNQKNLAVKFTSTVRFFVLREFSKESPGSGVFANEAAMEAESS